MSKNRRLSGWHLIDDNNWKERLAEMASTHPPSADPAPHVETLKLTAAECDPSCSICHGESFIIDSTDCAIECPNARRKSRGGD